MHLGRRGRITITGDRRAARIRDAVAWGALPLADTGCADLAHDGFERAASMGERRPPIERTGRLDVSLEPGWATPPRGVLERVP